VRPTYISTDDDFIIDLPVIRTTGKGACDSFRAVVIDCRLAFFHDEHTIYVRLVFFRAAGSIHHRPVPS